MSTAIVPSRNRYKHRRHSDQRSQAARRDAFHRWLRYEPLEDRCLLSAGGSEVATIGDKIVNISAPDAVAGEPSDNGTFRITRSNSTTNPLTVNFYATGDAVRSLTGTGGDYCLLKDGTTLLSGNTVTIDAGQAYVDITLEPYADGQHKPTKTANLILQTGTGYDVGTSYEASITLKDEISGVLPAVTVVASDATAANPSNTGTYTISRPSTDMSAPLTVNFMTGGDAARGTDYTLSVGGTILTSSSVIIPTGQQSVAITLTVVPSVTAEPAETATLTVTSGGSGYAIGTPNTASITVTHNGSTVVSVAAPDATAGAPSDSGTFEITRAAPDNTSPLTVQFQMSGTAVEGTDYTLSCSNDTVTIPAGVNKVDITLTAANSATTATETALLTLESGTGYGVIAPPNDTATINIIDENPDVVTVSAPDSSAGAPSDTGVYRIARTGSLVSALTVGFTTGGNATLGTDYTLSVAGTVVTGNSVTIAAGQSYVDVTLAVVAGTTTKPSETASLTIQGGSGYDIGVSSSAAISIAASNVFSLSVAAVNSQAAEPSTNGTFRITRTGDTTGALTVDFTIDGTAIRYTDPLADPATSDYELETAWTAGGGGTLVTGNSVTIAAGQSSIDVTLVVIDNTTANYPRSVTMTLTDGTSVANSATITIADDDGKWQTVLPKDLCSAAGQPISIPVQYTTSTNDNTMSGLGLKLYYNSQFMTFTGLTNVLQTGLVSQEASQADTTNGDSDGSTDQYVMVSWADLAGNWPNQALPTTLYVANFTLNQSVTGTSAVNFTATAAPDYSFQPRSTTVTVAPINLDVNGNGTCDPLTDGILIMRYLFDPDGNWSTAGAIGPGATRTTYDQINSYLDAAYSTMLDVNGNGTPDALTDGMLIMRYLFDPSGGWTTTGLIGTGATNTTQAAIKSFLDSFNPTVSSSSLHLQQLSGIASQQESSATASAVSTSAEAVQNQIVTPSQTNISVSPGAHATFDVNYSTNPSDPTLSGLGLRMYYNSSLLTFNGLSNVLANGMISQETPQPDTNDSDGDPSTDTYVLVGWADLNQNWPGTQSQRLYSADFTLNSAATSTTHVNFDASSTAAGWTFASTPVTITPNAGPAIGCVVVSTANKVITWNVADSDGVAGSSLKIDGVNASHVYGPYAATSGVNYSGAIGTLSAGTHTYLITATDKTGHSSTYSGSFDVVAALNNGPAIGSVVVSMAKKVITWNAADAGGVAGSSLKIDGVNVSQVHGPYAATSGVNYSGAIGTLPAGSHQYVITATDKAGHSSSYFGSFDVVAAVNNGPTIGSVVVSAAKRVISWNAADADGVAGCSLAIDGVNVSQIRGPYAAVIGVNFSAAIGGLAVGAHTYVITARDKAGNSSSVTGTFSVSGAARSAPSATSLASDAVLGALAETAVSAKAAWLYNDSNLLLA